MKKIIIILLLLISINSFSQVDTTGKQAAKEEWLSNVENRHKPWPIWDDNGNVVGFIAAALLLSLYYRKSIIQALQNQANSTISTK
jgi:hypothetical protein